MSTRNFENTVILAGLLAIIAVGNNAFAKQNYAGPSCTVTDSGPGNLNGPETGGFYCLVTCVPASISNMTYVPKATSAEEACQAALNRARNTAAR